MENIEKLKGPYLKIEEIKQKMDNAVKDAYSEEEAKKLIKDALPKDIQCVGPIALYRENEVAGQTMRSIRAQVLYRDDTGKDHCIDSRFQGK